LPPIYFLHFTLVLCLTPCVPSTLSPTEPEDLSHSRCKNSRTGADAQRQTICSS
jgi:hypothetical protein